MCRTTGALPKKLTLEYGIRFYWVQPQYDKALQTSAWNKALYDPAATGRAADRGAGCQRQLASPSIR